MADTVVARVCLDMLRSRQSRREEPFTPDAPEPVATGTRGSSPEQEALLADSVGLALLVVLDRLTPAERLAFVLHDMFAMPFEEIAPIVGRSAEATRQLASRARRRVRGGGAPDPDLVRQREVVEAFLAALRAGDFEGLLAVLDPDLVVRADMAAGAPTEIRGAAVWAKGAVAYGHLAQLTRPALVNGAIGVVVAPQGRLVRALRFTIANGRSPRSRSSAIGAARRARRVDRRLRNTDGWRTQSSWPQLCPIQASWDSRPHTHECLRSLALILAGGVSVRARDSADCTAPPGRREGDVTVRPHEINGIAQQARATELRAPGKHMQRQHVLRAHRPNLRRSVAVHVHLPVE